MHEVILHTISKAHIHFYYSSEIRHLLVKNEHFFNIKTHFLRDSHDAHYKYAIHSLMLLYDSHRDAISLVKFLSYLKENAYAIFPDSHLAIDENIRKDISQLEWY